MPANTTQLREDISAEGFTPVPQMLWNLMSDDPVASYNADLQQQLDYIHQHKEASQ